MERSNETSLDAKLAPESFVADISFAARAIVSQPVVLLVPALLWSFPIVAAAVSSGPHHRSPWLFLFDIAIVLFWLGWTGAERIFFLRRLEKKSITLAELLGLVTSFLGRFAALGFRVGIAALLWAMPLMIVCSPIKIHPLRYQLGLAIFATAADFALTFVPSALAFTTRSSRRALRIGFRMIRRTWPRCGLYVLCPPLALNFVNTIYPMHLTSVRLVVTVALTFLSLVAKGATAAFYLREQPTHGPDGAAHLTVADEAFASVHPSVE